MPRTETTARRWTFRLGLVLILAGVVVLGYVAWQFWGTNWVSERKHKEIVGSIEQEWKSGKEFAEVSEGRATAVVRIPRFGKNYAVPLLEGTSDEALAAGIAHFEKSSAPGTVGNFALAGHRVTHGEPLRGMPHLEVGDEIIIETRKAVFTYVLDTGGDDLVVPFTETWVLDRLPKDPDGDVQPKQVKGQRLITLTTCAELFHTDDRMIAFGHLTSTTPKS